MDEQAEKPIIDLASAIISEINDCREDERNSQNMILQVISTVGGIIGVLTGASFIAPDNNVALARGLFILSGLILCVGYTFIFSLGITNSLRFHYLRSMEDRLYSLVFMRMSEEKYINWTSFSSPITTRNPKHIKQSVFTYAHYLSYTLATAFLIIFGLGMAIVLFLRIKTHCIWDIMCAVMFSIIMLFAFIAYAISCLKSKDMYEYALKASIEKRSKRMGTIKETQHTTTNAKRGILQQWLTIVGYYIYPRIVDFQKPLLIVLGFLMGLFFRKGSLVVIPTKEQMWYLLLVWFTVDFLVYQARYLWNDLRGLKDDVAANKKDRLPVHLFDQKYAIVTALVVMIIRLLLALILISYMPAGLRESIFVISLLVFVVAYFYEIISDKNCANGVFFMVSFGYPIRLLAGIMAAWPQFGGTAICIDNLVFQTYMLIPMFISFGLLGSYSSILSWTHKAADQKKRENAVHKGYYEPLITALGDRTYREFPLREQGRLSDQWSVVFNISVILLSLTLCTITLGFQKFPFIVIAELLFTICICFFSVASIKKANAWIVAIGVVLLLKTGLGTITTTIHPLFIFISILQALFVFLYYFMRYMFSIDYSFLNTCKFFLIGLAKMILGKKTVSYLNSQYANSESLKK